MEIGSSYWNLHLHLLPIQVDLIEFPGITFIDPKGEPVIPVLLHLIDPSKSLPAEVQFECVAILEIQKERRKIAGKTFDKLSAQLKEISKMLFRMIENLEKWEKDKA